MDINLFGVVRGCKVFTRLFKQQGHGYFVNIASMAGLIDSPMMSSYNASKAAVVMLSETLQIELADEGIGVSVVCPSFFKTNLAESMRSTDPRIVKSLHKLFEHGKVSAGQIAAQIYQAQQAGRFYVLPHADARKVWRLKRLLPRAVYVAMALRQARRIKQRRAAGKTEAPAS